MKNITKIIWVLWGLCFALFGGNSLLSAQERGPEFRLDAREFTKRIRIGWNLGNTLEAHTKDASCAKDSADAKDSAGKTPSIEEAETLWWNPVTTEAND